MYTLLTNDHSHVAIFNGLYDPLATVPIMIWLTDRVLRVGRILCFNPKFWTTRAVATYDSDANLVRLEISLAKSFYQFPPGTYCYLMVLHDKTFWQSHPFTIASVRSSVAAKESTEDSDELGPLLQLRSSYEHVDAPVDDEAAENKADVATILVRPYDQFTGRLRDLASEKSGASRSLRVVVEGPYGHTRRLGRFDKVVFITGGSGIAVPLSYLDMLLRRGNGSVVSSVEVHWAVREAPFATKTVSEDMGAWLRDERFSVFTYVSASSRCGGDAALAALEATGINFEMRRGRLECIDRISKAAQAMHHDGAGSLAVVCCGPAGMADDCRQAVARVLSAARGARIEYFEESYNW
jgi:23S rRNA pseudoU1915 N3-methylase RlmH